ncbi:MAG: hypothetical protein WCO11_07045 [Sphingomonadales bacterium]|jgi:hypothetical protein
MDDPLIVIKRRHGGTKEVAGATVQQFAMILQFHSHSYSPADITGSCD